MRAVILFSLALAALLIGSSPGYAASSVESAQARVSLIAERDTVAAGDTLWVGLKLEMKPGWHTYWRTPGDSGLPAGITWTLPQGVTAGAIQWPPPERVPTGDLMNFGYEGTVVLPVPLTVAAKAGAAELVADATWLVCSDVCIPEDGHFTLPVTVGAAAGPPGPDAAALDAARAQVPKPAPFPVHAQRDGATFQIVLGPGVPEGVTAAQFFPDGEGAIANAAPQKATRDGAVLRLSVPVGATPPTRLAGVVVFPGPSRIGYEIATDVAAATPGGAGMTLWIALAFAVLGGLILNVMPCVLPVLVMKALSMVSRRENAAIMRRDALIYTAGVVVAFTGLIVTLLALRAAGGAVGWGFQLQNPIVVAALANVMLLLGLSLSGVFTVGAGVAGVGQGLTQSVGGWGSFFTGVLAVVVATPCTAPFMGVALGFALTQSAPVAIAVFEGLAVGLALPYLLVAFVPALARLLPRPGVWMDRLKQLLAFPLYGAAAWLVWVVAQQLDPAGLAMVFASLICAGFAAWAWGVMPQAAHGRVWAAIGFAGLILAGATIAGLTARGAAVAATPEGAAVEPFSAARVAALRGEGKPVLVNFTAAWCITCMVNERVALSTATVKQALRDRGIVYLKGDWTNRSPEITQALHDLGRDGVPVYVYYPPNGEPELLPQVLTPAVVLAALDKR